MNRFYSVLRDNDLKATPQRLAILKATAHMGHVSIEELAQEVANEFPATSLTTIYKNVHALHEIGIIKQIPIEGQKPKYEITKEEHIHLVCQKCCNVTDYIAKEGFAKEAFSIISLNTGFNIKREDVTLYGLCQKCQ